MPSAELKPRGYYLEHIWQADMGYIGQAMIGAKVPNSGQGGFYSALKSSDFQKCLLFGTP